MAARRWTAEDSALAVSLRADGLTAQQIADRMGRTRRAVWSRWRFLRSGRPRNPPGAVTLTLILTRHDKAAMADLAVALGLDSMAAAVRLAVRRELARAKPGGV